MNTELSLLVDARFIFPKLSSARFAGNDSRTSPEERIFEIRTVYNCPPPLVSTFACERFAVDPKKEKSEFVSPVTFSVNSTMNTIGWLNAGSCWSDD
jgi:hypothetical protein